MNFRWMKAAALSCAALLALAAPAHAVNLLNKTITTFNTAAVTTPLQFLRGAPPVLQLQANFTYGSGGTSVDAYVQTTLDGGTTWIDIAEFSFTTTSGRKVVAIPTALGVPIVYTATDGSLAANTALSGLLGSQIRVKYTTVGTYATSTKLSIDAQSASPLQP